MNTLGTWSDVRATWSNGLGLAVWQGGQLAGMHLSVARAMEMVNHLVGKVVWSE